MIIFFHNEQIIEEAIKEPDTIVNFINEKLKSKHTFLKKYTNWAKLSSIIFMEREETKTRYFAPKSTQLPLAPQLRSH